MIDFWLCDLTGRTIDDFAALPDSSVTLGINSDRTASVALSFDEPAAALIRPLSTVVKASWDRGHLFTGACLRPTYSGRERRLVVSARGPSARLAHAYTSGRSDGVAMAVQTGVDQAEILARLMEHASPSAAELAAGVPGHGLARGSLPASRTRDRTYAAGKQIMDAMTELSSVIDGVDFDFRAVDQTNGVYALLDTYYPTMGSARPGAIFQYGWGAENVTDLTIEPGGDLVRNRSIHVGQINETTQVQPLSRVDRSESVLEHGLYAEYVGDSEVTVLSTLTELATATVSAYGYPPYFITLTPSQDDGSGYLINAFGVLELLPKRFGQAPVLGADYWLGDTVSVVARDGPAMDFDLQARVVQIVLRNGPNGAVVPELTLAPLLGGGYRIPGVLPPSFIREFAAMREQLRLQSVIQ